MKKGVALGADYIPYKELFKISKLAESLGFNQISVPEIWGHDQVSTITTMLNLTENITVSSGIMNMYSRTPALVAMTAASLSEMSEGRFILGLGLSGPQVVRGLHGRDFKKPIKHTREFVKVVRDLLSYSRAELDSELLGKLSGFRLSFKPSYNVPIHIAALGPRNMRLTSEIADGWIPVFMSKEGLSENIEKMRTSSPTNLENFEITPFILSAVGEDEKIKNLLRAHLGYYFGGMGTFYNEMLKRMGFESEADEIMSKFQKGDVNGAYAAITDEMLYKTCVFGEPADMRDKLENYYKIGVTTPIISVPFRAPPKVAMDTLMVFGNQ